MLNHKHNFSVNIVSVSHGLD